MTDLAQVIAGWPLIVSMAATVAAQGLRSGKRRTALNEALHELRRPLQAVALTRGSRLASSRDAEDSMGLAAAALERLDREINGGPVATARGTVDCRLLAQSAVGRWRERAMLADGSLELRWSAGGAIVCGDRWALAQALDNLIVNAIEHGGPSIVVAARLYNGRLRIAVVDSGRTSRPCSRRTNPTEALARLSGRRRRGHGLAVVRRVASLHDGHFELRPTERGSLAVLELPLAEGEAGRAA